MFFSLGKNKKRNAQIREVVAATGQHAFQLAMQYVQDSDAAKDIVQQSFIKLLEHKDTPQDGLNYWFLRIVRNTAIDVTRHQQSKQRLEDDIRRHDEQAKQVSSSEEILQQAQQRQLDKHKIELGLNKLKPEQREIIVLKDIHDYSYEQIAAILDVAKGTVMSRLHRARLALKHEVTTL